MQKHDVDVYCLNDDRAVACGSRFVARYASCNFGPHWSLRRIDARDAGPDEAGCEGKRFSGRLECLRQSAGSDRHVFMVDDTTDFCHLTQHFVDAAITTLPETGWDMVLTDTIFPCAHHFPSIMMLWHELRQTREIRLLDLYDANIMFRGGATLINRRSKERVLELMHVSGTEAAWDRDLPQHVRHGRIKACLIVPLLTAPAICDDEPVADAADPAILETMLCNAFRRMMWIGEWTGEANRPYYSEWSRHAYRKLMVDDVVRMSSVMTPLLSMQLDQRWHLKAAEILTRHPRT